jgi:Type II secretion system (T2SS), protein E, N-terminal domain
VATAILRPWFEKAEWNQFSRVCGNVRCRAHHSRLRSVKRRRNGISLHGKWYCSAECFEAAAVQVVSRLESETAAPEHHPRLPLGLTLLSRGVMTEEQLRDASCRKQTTGQTLLELVRELGYVSEAEIAGAVAEQWNCPLFRTEARPAEMPARCSIPLRLLRECGASPVHFSSGTNTLFVGFASAVDYRLVNQIRELLMVEVQPCIINLTAYRGWLAETSEHENEVVFERSSAPSEITRIVRNYCMQTGAEEARFGKVGDFLWACLVTPRGGMNILFRIANHRWR